MLKRTNILLQNIKKVNKYIPPSERAIKEHEKFNRDKKRNERIGKYVRYGTFILVAGSVTMYLWQPWNPYSTNVSKDLRKGLWEERDGNDQYLKALKNYQKGLNTAKDEGMDQLSLKYTGIVLKIGEMYEKLDMKEQLLLTYYNLSTFIFENLIRNKIDYENPERDLLIDRDLIVITRWAMLKLSFKDENSLSKVIEELRDRVDYIENYEIPKRLPWAATNNKKINILELIDIWSKRNNGLLDINKDRTKWIEDNIESEEAKDFINCWELTRTFQDKVWPAWIESYLKLRDFYAMTLMNLGRISDSLTILQSNFLWTAISGFNNTVSGETQILNIGSSWFQLGQKSNNKLYYGKAIDIYLKLISSVDIKNPILPITYYSLGVAYLQLNNTKLSEKYLNKSKELAIDFDQIQIINKIDDIDLSKTETSLKNV